MAGRRARTRPSARHAFQPQQRRSQTGPESADGSGGLRLPGGGGNPARGHHATPQPGGIRLRKLPGPTGLGRTFPCRRETGHRPRKDPRQPADGAGPCSQAALPGDVPPHHPRPRQPAHGRGNPGYAPGSGEAYIPWQGNRADLPPRRRRTRAGSVRPARHGDLRAVVFPLPGCRPEAACVCSTAHLLPPALRASDRCPPVQRSGRDHELGSPRSHGLLALRHPACDLHRAFAGIVDHPPFQPHDSLLPQLSALIRRGPVARPHHPDNRSLGPAIARLRPGFCGPLVRRHHGNLYRQPVASDRYLERAGGHRHPVGADPCRGQAEYAPAVVLPHRHGEAATRRPPADLRPAFHSGRHDGAAVGMVLRPVPRRRCADQHRSHSGHWHPRAIGHADGTRWAAAAHRQVPGHALRSDGYPGRQPLLLARPHGSGGLSFPGNPQADAGLDDRLLRGTRDHAVSGTLAALRTSLALRRLASSAETRPYPACRGRLARHAVPAAAHRASAGQRPLPTCDLPRCSQLPDPNADVRRRQSRPGQRRRQFLGRTSRVQRAARPGGHVGRHGRSVRPPAGRRQRRARLTQPQNADPALFHAFCSGRPGRLPRRDRR